MGLDSPGSNATFNSLIVLALVADYDLSSIAPRTWQSREFKSGEFGGRWSFSMKPGQIETILREKSSRPMRWCAVLLKDESSWQETFANCN